MRNYSTLESYLNPPAGFVVGPKLPEGTPNLSNQKVLVDNLRFGNQSLTHGGVTDGRDYYTVDNAYPAASRNLCSSLQNVSCPSNLPSGPQNYVVPNASSQVAVPIKQAVNPNRGVFDMRALAEAHANGVGSECVPGSRGSPMCAQGNCPTGMSRQACESMCGRN